MLFVIIEWFCVLILYLLTWRISWAPNNANIGQMEFNSAFKVLMCVCVFVCLENVFVLGFSWRVEIFEVRESSPPYYTLRMRLLPFTSLTLDTLSLLLMYCCHMAYSGTTMTTVHMWMQIFARAEYIVLLIICHRIGLIRNIWIAGIILRKALILATQSQLHIKTMGIKHQKY